MMLSCLFIAHLYVHKIADQQVGSHDVILSKS